MYPAILDQLREGQACGFSPDVVERADDDDSRRVVYDHVHTGEFLKRADIAAFAADDSSFHVVAGDIDRADGCVRRVLGGVAMDARRQDLTSLLFTRGADGSLVLLDPTGYFVGEQLLQPLQKHAFRLLAVEAGDLVKFG